MHKRGVNATVSYKIFVINMAGSAERWNFVKFQLEALNLAYERIEGVDASVLDNSEIASYYSRAENRKQFYRNEIPTERKCDEIMHVRNFHLFARQVFQLKSYIGKLRYFLLRDGLASFLRRMVKLRCVSPYAVEKREQSET